MRKRLNKTLTLKKNTVANLNMNEMKDLNGGTALPTGPICEPTNDPICRDNTKFLCYTQDLSLCAAWCSNGSCDTGC